MPSGLPKDQHNQWLEQWPVAWSETLHSGRNWLGLALRNFLAWESGVYQEPRESKGDLFRHRPEAAMRAEELLSHYSLTEFPAISSRQRYCEVLTYLDWLDSVQQAAPDVFQRAFAMSDSLSWLDVGAKNWAYVDALAAFIQAHFIQPNGSAAFRLDGIELDPNRRYQNLQTRRQAALAHSRSLLNAHYHEGNVLAWTNQAQIISHFLPFVFKEPHLAWGLPLSYFKPADILRHLLSLLKPNGLLIIVNQGEVEAEAQQKLLEQAAGLVPLHVQNLGQLSARFIEYKYPRYGWLCVKEAE
jgi:hypothetical protein